ncbi:chemotaxis protein, partial [Burkholderia gladioli]
RAGAAAAAPAPAAKAGYAPRVAKGADGGAALKRPALSGESKPALAAAAGSDDDWETF